MSDGHSSRYGRRRPYILGGLVSSTFGLLLVMYGQAIGDLLGDLNDVHVRADDRRSCISPVRYLVAANGGVCRLMRCFLLVAVWCSST